MRVGIRVDASPEMGIGHLRRCLSLAHGLRETGAKPFFVTRDLGVDSTQQIAAAGFEETIVLERGADSVDFDPRIPHAVWARVSQDHDARETIQAMAGFEPSWIVVDSYSFDGRWHSAVRDGLGSKILQIDDIADRDMAPDLLVDHNLAADHEAKYAGRLPPQTPILGGPRYALLGARYASARRYAFSEQVSSIGIFMGGIDAGNYSVAVLEALNEIGFVGEVEVVTTSANPRLDVLRAIVEARRNTTLTLDLADLAEFFSRHDVQIGAGGGASWERCCIGVPSLLVVVATNQETVAPQLAAKGVIALARSPDRAEIAGALADLIRDTDKRRCLADRARELVDGLGAARVAKEMQCRV